MSKHLNSMVQDFVNKNIAIGRLEGEPMENHMNWLAIADCPEDEEVVFASFYTPSDHAAKNGAKARWHYGTGRRLRTTYTGILGYPSHFAYLTPPTQG